MLTPRAWWCLFAATALVPLGLFLHLTALTLSGLALYLWIGGEWLWFLARLQGRLIVERVVGDERGATDTLWAGRSFTVRVRVRLDGPVPWAHALISDFVPYGVEYLDGPTFVEGPLRRDRPFEWSYRVRVPAAGVVRFEGVRVQTADLQGFFVHSAFLRSPLVLRSLPVPAQLRGAVATTKQHNLLLPPGIHRLRASGAGSDLLDLRDYRPGDPPRTIAWKVSARRGRLITKELESEVPIRCTLFVDSSASVRVPASPMQRSGPGTSRPFDRLVELTAGLMQSCVAARDPVGLCLSDEAGATWVAPGRSGTHQTQMLRLLADAAALPPHNERVHPDHLLPLAYSFAQEVYPELLRPAVNAVPWWFTWFLTVPGYARRLRTLRESLYHHKRKLFFLASAAVMIAVVWLPSPRSLGLFLALLMAPTVVPLALYVLAAQVNRRRRRLSEWRKRLAALLSVRYGLAPGGLEVMLEDDDIFSALLQRFLADHHVPYALPLYDGRGRYRFAAPEKVSVLSTALLQAVGRGHDNELFVLLVDLLELDEDLAPLLAAVRVALARHHQVVLICPWPAELTLPATQDGHVDPLAAARLTPKEIWDTATRRRIHTAYARIRRTFVTIGVPVVCAADDEVVPLVLDRMEQLRRLGGRRR